MAVKDPDNEDWSAIGDHMFGSSEAVSADPVHPYAGTEPVCPDYQDLLIVINRLENHADGPVPRADAQKAAKLLRQCMSWIYR